ncbi:MAG: indole-3-glycerol phosphate synthase TrpC [Deltaproteobacteria bacterium]|nr:MAG: indole-3-glycerol phosphate synthase TrpC [Deltaproteobacteria bacterium]
MILDDIVARKREEVDRLKKLGSQSELERAAESMTDIRDFMGGLENGARPAIIAEIKRASPSAGLIRPDLDVTTIAATYEREGAAAISVITEEHFFQGSLEYLHEARESVSVPLLCKDFIIDPIQVHLARASGADALLLITSILDQDLLAQLIGMSRSLGMACLVEVHDPEEVARALAADARIIGINNRDLRTFKVDLDTTRKLRSLIPPGRLVVSESGIQGRDDMQYLAEVGVDAVLVGTSLMKSEDPGQKLRELTGRS